MASTIKNAGYYTVGNIVKAAASFVLLPIYANMLGVEQYGILNLLQTFSAILVVLMTFAIERSLYRLYYDYYTEKEKNTFLSTVFWSISIISILITITTLFTGQYIVKYVGNVDVYRVLMPTVLYTFAGALINYSQILMQVEEKGGSFIIISILFLVIYNLVSLLFLFYYSQTVEALVYGNLIANCLVLPIAFYRIKNKISFSFSFSVLRTTIRYSTPMFIAIVFAWVLNMTDRIFIANLANYADAGVYSLASKIVQFAILFVGAIAQAYAPFFYKIANSHNLEDAQKKLKPVCNVYTGVICALFIIVVFLTKPLLAVLFDSSYEGSVYFVYLLALSGIFSQQSAMLNLMVYQNKKVVAMSAVGIVCGIVSVVLNILFIPRYGAIAAGFSNLIVGILIFALTHFLARRNYYIPYGYGFTIYSVVFVAMCFAFDITDLNVFIALALKLICSIVLVLIAVAIRLIEKNDYIMAYNKIAKPYLAKFLGNRNR